MVFIINGYPGAGKDTFVELVKTVVEKLAIENRKIVNISTIDYLKEIFIKDFNWDGIKTKDVRVALANIHTILTNWNDIPFKKTCEKVRQHLQDIVFIHCREPENIEKYKKEFNAITLFVDNQQAEKVIYLNKPKYAIADLDVKNYNYDIIINNNGTFEDLEREAENFVIEKIYNL